MFDNEFKYFVTSTKANHVPPSGGNPGICHLDFIRQKSEPKTRKKLFLLLILLIVILCSKIRVSVWKTANPGNSRS
jgi:hypothetical protein